MGKKQQIILLHGSDEFTDKDLIVKGELVVEHGSTAVDVKLHTLDDSGEIATFVTETSVDNKISTEIAKVNKNSELEALQERVNNIDAAYKDADTKIRKDFADADATLKSDYEAADATLSGRIDALDANKASKTELSAATETLRSEIAEAQKAASSKVVEGTDAGNNMTIVSTTSTTDGSITYTVNLDNVAKATDLEGVSAKVTTLIGTDADKSVRTIANEELAAVLLDGAENGAEDNFKTLKEIADWIEKHPEDAAEMNTNITANANAITAETSARKTADTTLQNNIDAEKTARENADNAIDAKIGGSYSSSSTVHAAITANTKAISDEATARANADNTLQSNIDKKADKTTVDGIDGRLATVEGAYVKQVKITLSNNVTKTYSPVDNVLDLSELVIDGGTY